MINTREELVNALTEAAELEHGLLVQYLFAAFSLKRREDEGITSVEQARIGDWEGLILSVARDEMKHLGIVCNLLAAIGGAPRFGRANFPQPAKKFFPWDFDLLRFSDEALYRFICFELPKGEPPPEPPIPDKLEFATLAIAPEPVFYEHVGELYGQIKEGFFAIDESKLFIGPKFTQDTERWTLGWDMPMVTDRISAEKVIRLIVEEGEGSPGKRENSHYERFIRIRNELKEMPPGFKPARPVVKNPSTQNHPDASGQGTLITNADTRDVAELFSAVYNTSLLMLMQHYSFGGETPPQRKLLRASLGQIMSAIIRPLAEVLTELPVGMAGKQTAGPGFEIYADLRLSTTPANRWAILFERLEEEVNETKRLSDAHPRLKDVAMQLDWLRQNIQKGIQEV